jgi:hypothetical protein
VTDCPNNLVGNAFRALVTAGPVGQATLQAIVDKSITIHAVTGSQVTRRARLPTIGVSSGSDVWIAEGLKAGAAAAVIGHEVNHLSVPANDFCQGEVQAQNAGLDVYDALPAGDKENAPLETASKDRKADPKAYNAKIVRTIQSMNLLRRGVPSCDVPR